MKGVTPTCDVRKRTHTVLGYFCFFASASRFDTHRPPLLELRLLLLHEGKVENEDRELPQPDEGKESPLIGQLLVELDRYRERDGTRVHDKPRVDEEAVAKRDQVQQLFDEESHQAVETNPLREPGKLPFRCRKRQIDSACEVEEDQQHDAANE